MSTADTAAPQPERIVAAIVDDHPVTRYGIAHLLTSAGITVAASVGRAPDLHATGLVAAYDVVVTDLYLDATGPALAEIGAWAADTSVLVISASARPGDVAATVRCGASGYLTKHASEQLLLHAVRTVAAGGFALSAELADILHTELRSGPTPGDGSPPARLSPREEQTLAHLARGLTHAQIAARMGVRKATVDTYVERIRSKLQLGNKAELTRAALQRMPPS
ncbi:LuxR C-terminal-related transcriptional regulator [Micromonospora sp. NPDC006431]|uniref:LuxR C-terminal-related transcriptional regulator n=1 Tax=Micromonospora sp. NPDC006431 TaxID=3364235 RepID=UPI0036CC3DF1